MQVGTTKDQGLYNKPSAAVHPGALAAGTLLQYNIINKQKQVETRSTAIHPNLIRTIPSHGRISVRYFVTKYNIDFAGVENFNRRIWQQTPFVRGKRDSIYLFRSSGCQGHDNWCFFFHRHRRPHQQMNCRPRPSSQNNQGKKRKIRWESRDEVCVCVYVRARARVCVCIHYNIDFPAHPFVWPSFEPKETALLHNL